MAYQPKSYRKFLATSVAAAMVATVAAPLAGAAGNFSDVAEGTYYTEAVDYLVGNGVLSGFPDGSFQPNAGVTRAQASKMLVEALGLEVPETVELTFTDTKNDVWYSGYVAALVNAGIVVGNPDGTFAPSATITRAALSKMVVEAYELTSDASQSVNFTDTVNGAWYEGYVNTLASLGIVQGTSETTFAPNATVTRAQASVFLHRTEVPTVRVTPAESELKILKVTGVDPANRFLTIQFSQPVSNLEPTDILIQQVTSRTTHGVKDVKLSSNGKMATVELFGADDATAAKPIVKYITEYNVTVSTGGQTLTSVFIRPMFSEGRVIDINVADKEITVANDDSSAEVTLDVLDPNFDYQAAIGELVYVWYNKDKEIVKYETTGSETKYDAIEVTDLDEIELLAEGVEYDISEEEYDNSTTTKFKFFLDGEDKTAEFHAGDYLDKKYNFAKVGFDTSGDIEYVSAYNLNNFLIVDKVEGDEVIGYEGEGTGGAFDSDDTTIVKDGKIISRDDLVQGDVVYFSTDADDGDGFAEVYSNTVTGDIDAVYLESVKVNGENYDFVYDADVIAGLDVDYAGGPVFLNEDGDTEFITDDEAEELQAGGEVTLHLDRAGNLVYIAGATQDVASNTKVAMITATMKDNVTFGDTFVKFEFLTEDGQEEVHSFELDDLDTITVNGAEYDIDGTPNADEWNPVYKSATQITLENGGLESDVDINLSLGGFVELQYDNNGKIKEMGFFTSNSTEEGVDDLASNLEAGDTYFKAVSGSKKLNANTLVFDATDDPTGFDADDIYVSTWGDYKGSDIDDARVVYDDDNEAIAIVIESTTSTGDVFEEAVITNVLRNTDNEIIEISAYINGEEQTLEVDELEVSLSKGDAAVLRFDESNLTFVEGIDTSSRIYTGLTVDAVNVGERKVTFSTGDAVTLASFDTLTFKLVSDGAVLDGTDNNDITVEVLSDLRGEGNVTIVTDEVTGNFIKFFIIE